MVLLISFPNSYVIKNITYLIQEKRPYKSILIYLFKIYLFVYLVYVSAVSAYTPYARRGH